MEILSAYFAHIVVGAVTTLLYMVFKIYRENAKFVQELQFFLQHKTVAYNRARATTSVLKTRLANAERENIRLKKSLEVLSQDYNSRQEKQVSSKEFIQSTAEDLSHVEQEMASIKKLLNGDFKSQVKDFERELEWLNKRLTDLQQQLEGKRRKAFESLSAADLDKAA